MTYSSITKLRKSSWHFRSRKVFPSMILLQRRKQRGRATCITSHSFAEWGRAGQRSDLPLRDMLLIELVILIRGNKNFDLPPLFRYICDAHKTRKHLLRSLPDNYPHYLYVWKLITQSEGGSPISETHHGK